MPLYEYQCEPCDHTFEALIHGNGNAPHCPKCGSANVAKLLSVPAAAQTGQNRAQDLPIGSAAFVWLRPTPMRIGNMRRA